MTHLVDHLGRPVRRPHAQEYAEALAHDLSRTFGGGVEQDKARMLLTLPLFRVALDGGEGMDIALRMELARQAERKAA